MPPCSPWASSACSPSRSLSSWFAGACRPTRSPPRRSRRTGSTLPPRSNDRWGLARSAGSGDWQPDVDGCAFIGRAAQRECAAERLHPVTEADEAGATLEIGAAATIVANPDVQYAIDDLKLDVNDRGGGVLGGVRKCLGHDVIRGELDRFGEALVRPEFEANRYGRASCERLDRGAQPTLGEDRGVEAASELTQIVEHAAELGR